MAFGKGHIPWNKGLKGRQVGWCKGKTKEDYLQLSNAGVKKGNIPWNKGMKTGLTPRLGIKHTKETKQRIKDKRIGISNGEKHWNWQGGISKEPYSLNWTDTLREAIRQRDNYICKECETYQSKLNGFYKVLDVHHIDYDKKNCNPNNLIALCRSCHLKTNINKEYWIKYFTNLLINLT